MSIGGENKEDWSENATITPELRLQAQKEVLQGLYLSMVKQ